MRLRNLYIRVTHFLTYRWPCTKRLIFTATRFPPRARDETKREINLRFKFHHRPPSRCGSECKNAFRDRRIFSSVTGRAERRVKEKKKKTTCFGGKNLLGFTEQQATRDGFINSVFVFNNAIFTWHAACAEITHRTATGTRVNRANSGSSAIYCSEWTIINRRSPRLSFYPIYSPIVFQYNVGRRLRAHDCAPTPAVPKLF